MCCLLSNKVVDTSGFSAVCAIFITNLMGLAHTFPSTETDNFSLTFVNCVNSADWDVPESLDVANGAGELTTKRRLDREGPDGPERTFYIEMTDKEGLKAERALTIVIADEDDNKPRPGHKDVLIYNYRGWFCWSLS